MMDGELLHRIRRMHWAVLVFLGAALLQLICSGLVISSSFWGHTLIVYSALLLLLTPALMLLALVIEFIKRAVSEGSRLRLVGMVFTWSILISVAFLLVLGPLAGTFQETDFIGGTYFNWHVYYVSGRSEDGAGYVFDLHECNAIALNCQQLAQIAEGRSREFTLEIIEERLEIKYDDQLVYTVF